MPLILVNQTTEVEFWNDVFQMVSLIAQTEMVVTAQDTRYKNINKLECGPMPNVMVALPNIGVALCSTPQSLADAHYSIAMQ